MATTKNTARTATPAKAAAKATTAPTVAPAAPAAAPQAPLYTYAPFTGAQGKPGQPGYVPAHGWPAKAQAGNSIRAYCAAVAQQLAAQHPGGFTLHQYAQALAANANGSTYKQPGQGWGAKLGNALTHANYFAGARAGYWLVPVGQPVPGSVPAK